MLLEINNPKPVPLEEYFETDLANKLGKILLSIPLPSSLILTTISRSFLFGAPFLTLLYIYSYSTKKPAVLYSTCEFQYCQRKQDWTTVRCILIRKTHNNDQYLNS